MKNFKKFFIDILILILVVVFILIAVDKSFPNEYKRFLNT